MRTVIQEIGCKNFVGGLADAVTKCAAVLIPVFPHRPGDKDEIPDYVASTRYALRELPELVARSRKWRPHGDSNPGYRRERAMS